MNCYVAFILLNNSECWTISLRIRRNLEAAEIWFYRRGLRIRWTDRVSEDEVLKKIATQWGRWHHLNTKRMEGLENLALIGHTGGKRDRGRKPVIYQTSWWENAWGNRGRKPQLREKNCYGSQGVGCCGESCSPLTWRDVVQRRKRWRSTCLKIDFSLQRDISRLAYRSDYNASLINQLTLFYETVKFNGIEIMANFTWL